MPWYSVDAVFEAEAHEIPPIVSVIRDMIGDMVLQDGVVSVTAVQIPDDDRRIPRRGA
jgi:hypothetical protein